MLTGSNDPLLMFGSGLCREDDSFAIARAVDVTRGAPWAKRGNAGMIVCLFV